MEDKFITKYLDYVNNFLTVQAFADYYDLTIEEANIVIEIGRKLNDNLSTSKN